MLAISGPKVNGRPRSVNDLRPRLPFDAWDALERAGDLDAVRQCVGTEQLHLRQPRRPDPGCVPYRDVGRASRRLGVNNL